jgi:hypothetical protein
MVDTPLVRESVRLYDPSPPITSNLSLEDVVKYYRDTEKARHVGEGEDDSQRLHIRSAINEMASSIRVVTARMRKLHKGVGIGVMTKCMARHMLSWYEEVIEVETVGAEYDEVFAQAKNGHTVIRKQMEQLNFRWRDEPESVNVVWEVPRFVMERLAGWQNQLGIDVHELLVHGMAWSISTLRNRDWDQHNVEQYFLPASDYMRRLVAFRRVDINAFASKIKIDLLSW